MGIKELKGRSLPGRSEEPSPDRPTTAISEAEGKRAATGQQRERSEFEQRKQKKAGPRSAKKEGAEGRSEFETGGRALPRPEENAGDLERYPHPRLEGAAADWLEGFGERPEPGERSDESSAPVLWGDRFETQAPGEEAEPSPEDRWGGEPGERQGGEEEELLLPEAAGSSEPLPGDLWEATGVVAVQPPTLVTPSLPSAPVVEAKPEVIPTRSTAAPTAPPSRPQAISARTMELPVVVLAPSGRPPRLGEEEPERTETVPAADPD